MLINTIYDIGDWVYVRHDPDQKKCMIYMIQVLGNGLHKYFMSSGTYNYESYEFEISKTKDVIMSTSN